MTDFPEVPHEPPPEELPWWAVGVCDDCGEPTDILIERIGSCCMTEVRRKKTIEEREAARIAELTKLRELEAAGWPTDEFADDDIPF